jgi:hypothetical protein
MPPWVAACNPQAFNAILIAQKYMGLMYLHEFTIVDYPLTNPVDLRRPVFYANHCHGLPDADMNADQFE